MTEGHEQTPATPGVLVDPLRNRGVAFTPEEREALGLTGRLPSGVLTLDRQAQRAYQQLRVQDSDLAKNVYLEQLHDRNETLYFKVLAELLPIVYDPTVGEAIEKYSHEYRRPRGLFLSVDRPDDMEKAFATLQLGPEDVDLIVCSDAEEILGIGDWGVGGIQISVGKLAVYTAAAGIDPRRVVAVSLDAGTDRTSLLQDPLYLGNRHPRVRGAEYDAFIEKYLETASSTFPDALLHFEDFGPSNARRILEQYGGRYRIFNDDMQGTGAITLAAALSAVKVSGVRMRDQKLLVFGAGTAGTAGVGNFLHAVTILADACTKMRECCIGGTELNQDQIDAYVDRSLMLVTALSPVIGYDKASVIAHKADDEDTTLRVAAMASGCISAEDFDRIVDPAAMVGRT
ncbi:malic enzyme-like protein [Streptomyces sp. Ag109_O5-1]|uniref:oxaloacetate-decarboxylating malate dehydrogenase n=1 Tax=Streptomyces sp. Ag109_O5-1 TaxID=1938851 RepID=UPI000F501E37|nr:oxaloacetate-decarboxylating malate dehydrogenase [Streptomyces sp. Ag109_O5-1]RPE39448.1 malic enzyme-like protein [Streptomyces sp. Ag109_O5-1]